MSRAHTQHSINRELERTYIKILILVITILEFIDIAFNWRDTIYRHYKIIDIVTAAVAISGILLSLKIIVTSRKSFWRPYAPIFLLILILLLEEISYGQEFIGFDSPKVGGIHFNALHDVFSLMYKHIGTYILILGGIFIFVFIKNYRKHVEPTLKKYPPYRFVLFAFVLLGLSILFDLSMIYHPPAEEYLEMLATLAVVFSEIAVYTYMRRTCLMPRNGEPS